MAWLLLVLAVGLAVPAAAQDQPTASPEPTAVPVPTAIPAAEIPARAGEAGRLLRDIETTLKPAVEAEVITERLDRMATAIDELEAIVEQQLSRDGPPEDLLDLVSQTALLDETLSGWLDTLASRSKRTDGQLLELADLEEAWLRTRDGAARAELPPAIVGEIGAILDRIDGTRRGVIDIRSEVLTLQVRVVEQRERVTELSESLRREVDQRKRGLVRFDSVPVWRALQPDKRQPGLVGQLSTTATKSLTAVDLYLPGASRRVAAAGALFAILLVTFVRLGRSAAVWVRSDRSLRVTSELLLRPVASSLLVSMVALTVLIRTTAPQALLTVTGTLLLLALLRLLPVLIRPSLRPSVTMLVGLTVLFLLVELVPSAYLLHRMSLLLLAVTGCGSGIWLLRAIGRDQATTWGVWRRAVVWITGAAVLLFAVSALANISGAVGLASLLAVATLQATYDALVLWVVLAVVLGAITVALRSGTAQKLRLFERHGPQIRMAIFRLFRLVAVLIWIGAMLSAFNVFDPVAAAVRTVFDFELALGTLHLSVSNLVVFGVVLWLSIRLSRLLRVVLDEDVWPRFDLPRGAPEAVSKISTYVVLTLGFFLAVAAAGLDLSRLTIIVGALGVGIGFGLQNVVNNFVSGLILLFERPVKVGDKIEIGGLSGEVQDIGIRASVVRTWQGAEVVVPNATLISDNLVNWTLSDPRRRMDIPVGVAYGTDPERVVEILLAIAGDHDGVLSDPEPQALFLGFGDSALLFELRAWTLGDFVRYGSELRIAALRALAGSEIEVPFPQRDLHLRTVAPAAADAMTDRRGVRSDAEPDDD
jgi:small-conductance mechanosensitive channel